LPPCSEGLGFYACFLYLSVGIFHYLLVIEFTHVAIYVQYCDDAIFVKVCTREGTPSQKEKGAKRPTFRSPKNRKGCHSIRIALM
jgi:hypothetical protein